jgi:hypothetical protein
MKAANILKWKKFCSIIPYADSGVATTVDPRWDSNPTYYGNGNFKLDLSPAGTRSSEGNFGGIGFAAWIHADNYKFIRLNANEGTVIVAGNSLNDTDGFSLRGVADNSGGLSDGTLVSSAYTDGSGNSYDGVVIGNLVWLRTNIKATNYQSGGAITNITGQTDWENAVSGGYCWYDNLIVHKDTYGALYNSFALDGLIVNSGGYRQATLADWDALTDYLIDTNWCTVDILFTNVSNYMKLNRQVNHPLG